MISNNYFIKKNYVSNPPYTLKENPKDYWNYERINNASSFQYHVYKYANKIFSKNKYSSLLDIGSGPGIKVQHFFDISKIRLHLVDQPGMESLVSKYCPKAIFSGLDLEVEKLNCNEKFDLIICADVIEHLENPTTLIDNIKNNLSENGIAIISTPDRDMRRGVNNFQSPNKAHVREWNCQEFKLFIESYGFKIIKQTNLPLKKLNPFLFHLSRSLLYKRIRKSDWFATQMVVMSK